MELLVNTTRMSTFQKVRSMYAHTLSHTRSRIREEQQQDEASSERRTAGDCNIDSQASNLSGDYGQATPRKTA